MAFLFTSLSSKYDTYDVYIQESGEEAFECWQFLEELEDCRPPLGHGPVGIYIHFLGRRGVLADRVSLLGNVSRGCQYEH